MSEPPQKKRSVVRLCERSAEARVLLWDPDALAEAPRDDLFDPYMWRARGAMLNQAQGRGAACFVRAANHSTWVLRHYRRGGALARINHDHYVWTGAPRTRPARELRLLAALYNRGLPVPRPVAARAVRRAGLAYTADLITFAIDDTEPLADRLMRAPIPAAAWRTLGGVVAELHQAGVWHTDLNARNVLIADDERFYLIDFDRARFRGDGRWRQANLARMRRSLDKFSANRRDFFFADNDWTQLIGGYRSVFAGPDRL